MKIALFGAGGMIGRRIAEEALARGHRVTAIARDPGKLDLRHERLAAATAPMVSNVHWYAISDLLVSYSRQIALLLRNHGAFRIPCCGETHPG